MKHFVTILAFLLISSSYICGQPSAPFGKKTPPKDAPDWLKIIDQGKNDPRLKGYKTIAGVKMEIVAEFPAVVNPKALTFGPDGSLYVVEWVSTKDPFPVSETTFNYQDGSKLLTTILKKAEKDRIKILQDANKDGIYEKAKVVLEEEFPSRILIHNGYLYVSGQGTVRRYQQTKKGTFANKEVIAQGFAGFHNHQVSGLTIGNDGWLYITAGDNDNVVEGSDGSRATVLRSGGVFRCRPAGSKLQTFASGFCNPFGNAAFDETGNLFLVDNGGANKSPYANCRLIHVNQGADFGWRLAEGARCWRADASTINPMGRLNPISILDEGISGGAFIYLDSHFPREFQGLVYCPNTLDRCIRAFKLHPNGASFKVAQEYEFLTSSDALFRPAQMVVGPDGAIYICDFRTERLDRGTLWGDSNHGRIYRLSWVGTENNPEARPGMDSWAKILKQTDEELLKTLESENFSDRYWAQQELVKRGVKLRESLLKILKDDEKPARARIAVIGILQSCWNGKVSQAFQRLLTHPHPDLRRLCAQGLELNTDEGDRQVHNSLARVLNEDNPAVLRAYILAIGSIQGPGAADTLVNTLKFNQSDDRVLKDGILRGIERTGKAGMDSLITLSQSGRKEDLNLVAEAYLSLRSPEAAMALPSLLNHYHLSETQRLELIESFSNYSRDFPETLDPLLDYLGGIVAMEKQAKAKNLPFMNHLREKKACLQVLASGKGLQSRKAKGILRDMLRIETIPAVREEILQALANGSRGED